MTLKAPKQKPRYQGSTIMIGMVGFSFALTSILLAMATLAFAFPIVEHSPTLTVPADTNTSTEELPVAPLRNLVNGTPLASASQPYPVAVMIENLPVVRPQAGLSQAAVVYETLVEGGATRFLAIFTDLSSLRIGPVRSARQYYLPWAAEYNALYAHAGGSPQAYTLIPQLAHLFDLDALRGKWAPYFFRDRSIPAPHNLFITGELATRALRDRGLLKKAPTITSWTFHDQAGEGLSSLSDARTVAIDFSPGSSFDVEWRYHDGLGSYERWNGGRPHTDADTGGQLAAANLIIQFVPRERSLGEEGRIDFPTTGEGKVLVFVGGKAVEGTWQKETNESRTRFVGSRGGEITLKSGPTWVEVVPGDRKVTWQ